LGNLTLIAIYTIAVSGLGLLMGYTGQVSLGQAAFMGLGAYGSAILSTRGINPWLALLASLTLTAALGWLIGRLALKLHGHFLALATLAAGIIIHLVFQEQSALTGGPSGLGGIPPLSLGPLVIQGERGYFYLTWILALLVLREWAT
jgi:branched-chain amino acid transport system permease protein